MKHVTMKYCVVLQYSMNLVKELGVNIQFHYYKLEIHLTTGDENYAESVS